MRKEELKYYADAAKHTCAKTFTSTPERRVSLVALFAVLGGVAGYQVSEKPIAPDQDAAANAPQILAELEAEKTQLLQNYENGESVSAFPQLVTDLVVKTLLNDDLSEQQRQDFLYAVDEELLDMSEIGFRSLEGCDCDDQVDDLSYIREVKSDIETDEARSLMSDYDKAVAMADENMERTPVSPIWLTFLGVIGAFLFGTTTANEGRKRAEKATPKKPSKYGMH